MTGPDAPAPAASSSSSGNKDDEERGREDESGSEATPAVLIRESHATRMGRLGGRGGAGNWLEKSPARDKHNLADEEKDELERKVRETVDEGLKVPEKTHNRVRRGDKV